MRKVFSDYRADSGSKVRYFILNLNKKAEMEMWQIILIVLSVLLLIFIIFFSGQLGGDLQDLLGKLGEIF